MKKFNLWMYLDDLFQNAKPQERNEQPEHAEASTEQSQGLKIELFEYEPDYDAQAEADRSEVLKAEYVAISEAIEMELADLEEEYKTATDARRSAISKRRLTLLSKRASNTEKIQRIDRKLERIYSEMH